MHNNPAPTLGVPPCAHAQTTIPSLFRSIGFTLILLVAPSLVFSQVLVSVVASDDTASETPADNGEFVIRRVGGNPTRPVTINYLVSGSASPGDDYEPLSGRATLDSAVSQVSVAVNVPGDDGLFEGDETITIRLLEDEGDDDDDDDDDDGDDGSVTVVGGLATVTILDSPHSVTASSSSNASENPAEDGQIDVSLGARNESGEPVRVEYSVAGSATPAVDYVALSGVATISVDSSTASVEVTPLDDDLHEGAETVEITLTATSDSSVSIGEPATASLSIADDDPSGDDGGGDDGGGDDDDGGVGGGGDDDDGGVGGGDNDSGDNNPEVRVSIAAARDANETPTENGEFIVRRVGGHSGRPVTLDYSVSGSASPGDDYAQLSGRVTLDKDEPQASIAIDVSGNDEVFEGDETVTIRLHEENNVVFVADSATLTILDSPHSIAVSRVSDAGENPLSVGQIRISLGARNQSGSALTLEYSVAGTATSGTDYEALSGSAVIPTGSSSTLLDIVPLDDDLLEDDETVEITLTGSGDSRVSIGTPPTASVSIIDDEAVNSGGSEADPDGDGLTNEREEELGTDPQVADTDGDGVHDGDEVADGSDPLDSGSFQDSDADLVPDAVEAAEGSNPYDPESFVDSDGGGTADHIETVTYASYGLPPSNPGNADDDRRDSDGDGVPDRLEVSLGSDPESADSPIADGAADDNGNGITNAVEEYLATLRIASPDSASDLDRDGYPDAAEVALGLNPLRAGDRDSDGDGVPDAVEAVAGVDIDATTDTDGDGVPDAREIAWNADPLDANSPIANGALDDDGDGVSNAIEHVLQLLDESAAVDASSDSDSDGITDADEIRFGTDPFRDEQPAAWIELKQADLGPVSALASDGGMATATAAVAGHRTGTLLYDWTGSDNAILAVVSGEQSDRTLRISPQTLPTGPYKLALSVQRTVGDYTSPVSTVEFTVSVLRDAAAAEIADADNDGVPDSFDDADARLGFANELQVQSGARMQAEPGIRLQLGATARINRASSARITHSDVASAGDGNGGSVGNSEDDFDYVSGIYDFEVTNLPEVGTTVQIVVPQAAAIGEFPEYRKFQPDAGWIDFVEDANNSISSAAGNSGACPAPGDDRYEPGLTPGHFCIQLDIEDGGPNDGDAVFGPNGIVKDPGGVATPKGQVNVGQGGGSLSPVVLLLLGLIGLPALWRRRRHVSNNAFHRSRLPPYRKAGQALQALTGHNR